jgi:AraC-like DNA-binding protein
MKILSLQEVADRLGIHVQTLKRHIYYTKSITHLVQYLGRSPGFTEDALPEIRRLVLTEAPQVGRGAQLSKAEAARRQDQARALREKGSTYNEIANKLGFASPAAARSAALVAEKRAASKRKKS